jgi:hypothetical protein
LRFFEKIAVTIGSPMGGLILGLFSRIIYENPDPWAFEFLASAFSQAAQSLVSRSLFIAGKNKGDATNLAVMRMFRSYPA